MTVAKVTRWLLFATAIVIVCLFLADLLFGWTPFQTVKGQAEISSAGPIITELEPVDFTCHVSGETKFILSGLKNPDVSRVGIGNIGFDISHGDTLIAFLAVVGQFEHCAQAEDQRVWHDGQTLFAKVNRIRLNRPALHFGSPLNTEVPSCSSVNSGQAEMETNPAEYEQTYYLCTGGFTLDQGEVAEFYSTLQAYAEWKVAQSQCAKKSTELFVKSITDHYQRVADDLGLELEMVGLDDVYIASATAAGPPDVDDTVFTISDNSEVCN